VWSVLGHMPASVDVDSLEPYTQLLQECLVLQPALLSQPPEQAGMLTHELGDVGHSML
jgi:hypothetical protein